jgi:DNA-binding transcriptional LysR family regulator
MLETRQLRYFVAVAEDLHFTQAADRLHVAQSALSTQVKQLEVQLGARLLARSKRSAVTLTDAGALLLVEARHALEQVERCDIPDRYMTKFAPSGSSARCLGDGLTNFLNN